MEWLDFSLMLNIINDDISKSNDVISNNRESNTTSMSNKSFAVNLPSRLKTK